MTWFLLLYVLPFFVSCIIGYRLSKQSGETRGNYLIGVLFLLIPVFNLAMILVYFIQFLMKSKLIENIREYLKHPL
jgi:heme/copper-type cytochrome/quinol oxidase subunit 2